MGCVRVNQVMAADQGQPRLFLRTDDLEGQSSPFTDFADKVRPVRGLATGFGGDAANPADPFCLELPRDCLKRIEGAVHRDIRELAALG